MCQVEMIGPDVITGTPTWPVMHYELKHRGIRPAPRFLQEDLMPLKFRLNSIEEEKKTFIMNYL